MPTGSVSKWVDNKGFGFILPDDGGSDIFVHRSSLDGLVGLSPGNRVRFDTQDDGKARARFKAVNVVVTGYGAPAAADGGPTFANLPLADFPLAHGSADSDIGCFLRAAGGSIDAWLNVEPFLVRSSLGCPFLAISDGQFVKDVRAPSASEFRELLALATRYVQSCEGSRAVFLAHFEGEMLGHGGELATAVFQPTAAVDATTLAPSPRPPGVPTALGMLLDMRSERCAGLARQVMESMRITKLMWQVERVFEAMLYHFRPLTTRIVPRAVVDAGKGFRGLSVDAMLTQLPRRLLAGLPRRDRAEALTLEAGNRRSMALPLSSELLLRAVEDVHRIEAILRSKVPVDITYAAARLATERVLEELQADPCGLAILGQRAGWFETSIGGVRTAHAVAIQRHIHSLRLRRMDLAGERAAIDDIEREVQIELARAGVKVPEDLSFSEVPERQLALEQPLGHWFPWQ